MTRPALLLFLLSVVSAAGELKGKPVVVEPHLPTQRTDFTAYHPVGEAIRIGEAVFPVARKGAALRVATKQGGKPGRARKREAVVKLAGGWRVHVRPRGDGWEYALLNAREFEFERVPFVLVDADADGRFAVGKDGYLFPPSPMVLPLGESLIVGRHRLAFAELSGDGRTLVVEAEPLAGSRTQLDGLVVANELRARAGLPPVPVDLEISKACSAHANYLRRNKWIPAKWNPHFEMRGRPGFSEAGHRAAMMSVISWGMHASAVPGYWDTYYHRFPFLHPRLKGLGISDGTPSVSVIDGKTGTEWGEGPPAGWRDPLLVPADGARHVPTNFFRGGELPIPVENCGVRGYPLTALFLAPRPAITGFSGELVRLGKHGAEPVTTMVPKALGGGGRFGLIPERPLRSASTYRVMYRFRRDGKPETVHATFVCR